MTGITKQQLLETLSDEIQELDFPLPPVEEGETPNEDRFSFWYDRIEKVKGLQNLLSGAQTIKLISYCEAYPYSKLFHLLTEKYQFEQQRVRGLR